MNLPQPGGKLGHVLPVEFGNLLVHRQARLLHQVGSVDPGGRPVVEQILSQEPQVPTIVLQQLSQSRLIARSGPLKQSSNDGVGIDLALAVANGSTLFCSPSAILCQQEHKIQKSSRRPPKSSGGRSAAGGLTSRFHNFSVIIDAHRVPLAGALARQCLHSRTKRHRHWRPKAAASGTPWRPSFGATVADRPTTVRSLG